MSAPTQTRPARRSSSTLVPDRLHPLALVGILLVGGWLLVAALAPFIAPYDPLALSSQLLGPPSAHHWFGTDEIGRDVLSRVLWGSRVSLPVAALLVAGILVIGGLLGAVAGYFGGRIDFAIMRLADLVFAFPTILLAMSVTAALGPGLKDAAIAVVLVAWPPYTRLVRGLVTSTRGADYVSATRLFGASASRALVIDVLPNMAGPVVVLVALDIGKAVLLLSALSFLGLAAQPPAPDWGSMVADSIEHFDSWWLGLFPGFAIFSAVLGSSFLGDQLRDAIDPKSSWSGAGKH